MALQEKAVLARLHISNWSGRKFDRRASSFVNEQYEANADVGRVNKRLVPKAMIAPVVREVVRSRDSFIYNTTPWLDNGTRLLKTKHYFKFMEEMVSNKSRFESQVAKFLMHYAAFINTPDQAKFMGKLFNQQDYPTVDELREKFSFNTSFIPVPTNNDWRIAVDEVTEARLKADLDRQIQEATALAQQDITDRIVKKVEHVYNKLFHQNTQAVFQIYR